MAITPSRDKKYAQFSRHRWALTDVDGVGAAVSNAQSSDRSVQASGTFNSGTVAIQGSNQNPAVDWAPLHDPAGVAITFTTGGIAAIVENPLHVRAVLTGTAGAALVNVDMISKGMK